MPGRERSGGPSAGRRRQVAFSGPASLTGGRALWMIFAPLSAARERAG